MKQYAMAAAGESWLHAQHCSIPCCGHASMAGLLSEKQAFLTSKVKQLIFSETSFVSDRTIDKNGVYSMWSLAGHVLRIQQTVTVLCRKHLFVAEIQNKIQKTCFYHNVSDSFSVFL